MDLRRYSSKISGPLLDRIDLHVWVDSVDPTTLIQKTGGKERKSETAALRARVLAAREAQQRRRASTGASLNSRLGVNAIFGHGAVSEKARHKLNRAVVSRGFSTRTFLRTLQVARTIADVAGEKYVTTNHISEALGYRWEVIKGERGW